MNTPPCDATTGAQKRDRDDERAAPALARKRHCRTMTLPCAEEPTSPYAPPRRVPAEEAPAKALRESSDDDEAEVSSDSDSESSSSAESSGDSESEADDPQSETMQLKPDDPFLRTSGDACVVGEKKRICGGGPIDILEAKCYRRKLNIPVYNKAHPIHLAELEDNPRIISLDGSTIFSVMGNLNEGVTYLIRVSEIDCFTFLALACLHAVGAHYIVMESPTDSLKTQFSCVVTKHWNSCLNTSVLMLEEDNYTGTAGVDAPWLKTSWRTRGFHILKRKTSDFKKYPFFFVLYNRDTIESSTQDDATRYGLHERVCKRVVVDVSSAGEGQKPDLLKTVQVQETFLHGNQCPDCVNSTTCYYRNKALVLYKHL